MENGIGIIKENLLNSLYSFSGTLRESLAGFLRSDDRVRITLDGETRSLLADFAQQNEQSIEQVAAAWVKRQADAYKQDLQVSELWRTLSDREQKVVALCCLGYADQEVANMLDIAYGTARTHLYNAIYKLGIRKKSELTFLLSSWDFSKFDLDFSKIVPSG
jgi:DNA-binding CsgD family transcriptional regulator